MKQLELKTGEINEGCHFCSKPEAAKARTYGDLIRGCLDHHDNRGFTLKDLRERCRIEKALDTSNGTLELEDADVDVLKRLMNSMRWGVRNTFVLEFCDEVEAL